MSTAKPGVRFLPTLTEVVQLASADTAPPNAGEDPMLDLTQRAMALLEARLAQRMEVMLKTQAQNVLNGLRDEMHSAVADAVQQALREGE